MRTLVYKRDHIGDPNERGCFGVCDCMGSVRSRNFEAVIGVGGMGRNPQRDGIDGKVTWIGIGPKPKPAADPNWRGPLLTFRHFVLYDGIGDKLADVAPNLAKRLKSARGPFTSFGPKEQAEIERLLKLAYLAPPSPHHQNETGERPKAVPKRAPSLLNKAESGQFPVFIREHIYDA